MPAITGALNAGRQAMQSFTILQKIMHKGNRCFNLKYLVFSALR